MSCDGVCVSGCMLIFLFLSQRKFFATRFWAGLNLVKTRPRILNLNKSPMTFGKKQPSINYWQSVIGNHLIPSAPAEIDVPHQNGMEFSNMPSMPILWH